MEVLGQNLVTELSEATSEADAVKTLFESLDKEGNENDIVDTFRKSLDGLSASVQTQIDLNLGVLEKETALTSYRNRLQALKSVVSTAKAPETTFQKITRNVGNGIETATDYVLPKEWTKDWSRQKKIAVGAAGSLGLLVLGVAAVQTIRGAWRRAKESNEAGKDAAERTEGGWMKKWAVRLGVTGLVLLGLYWLLNKTKTGREALGGAKEGAQNAWDNVNENLGPGIAELMKLKAVREVLSHPERYATRAEFMQAIVWATLKEGGSFIWSEGGGILCIGGRLIQLEAEFGSELWEFVQTGEIDTGEMVATYVEGVLLYATSLQALKILTIGKYGKGVSTLWEAGLWPYYTLKRVVVQPAVAGVKTARFGYELTQATGRPVLSGRRMALNMKYKLPRLDSMWKTADGLAARHAMLQEAMELRVHASARGHAALDAFDQLESKMLTNYQKYVQGLAKSNQLPEWFSVAARQKYPSLNIADLSLEQMKSIVRDVVPTGTGNIATATAAETVAVREGRTGTQLDDIARANRELTEIGSDTAENMTRAGRQTQSATSATHSTAVPRGRENTLAREFLDEWKPGTTVSSADNAAEALGRTAATQSDEALRVGAGSKLLHVSGKALGGGLVVAGVVLDTMAINENARALEEAKKNGNAAEVSRLESRNQSLQMERVYNTGTGIAFLANPVLISNPIGWVAIGGGLAVHFTSEALYERAKKLGETDAEYLQKSDEELRHIIRTDAPRALSALRAYLMHNVRSYEVDTATMNAWLEGSSWANDPLGFNQALAAGDSEAEALMQRQLYNRNVRIVSAQTSMLEKLAASRYGKKANYWELRKLTPEDYEMAGLYGDLHARYMHDDENASSVEVELQGMEKMYAALDTDLTLARPLQELRNKGGETGHLGHESQELPRLMYEDYDRSWKESDTAWALRMNRILRTLPATVGAVNETRESRKMRYQAFRSAYLSSFLSEEFRSIGNMNHVAIDATYTYANERTQTLFENLEREHAFENINAVLNDSADEHQKRMAHSSMYLLMSTTGELRNACKTFVRERGARSLRSPLHDSLADLEKQISNEASSPSVARFGPTQRLNGLYEKREKLIQEYAEAHGASSIKDLLPSLLRVSEAG